MTEPGFIRMRTEPGFHTKDQKKSPATAGLFLYWLLLVNTAQQGIDADFGAGLRIDFFHDNGGIQAMRTVFGRD